ncbi:SDR family NAD(P)-dependent oxidoreductase [Agrobacterium tumefaciens]|uniref:SDR family NAD(P)-dependent oxidoreductase n=1 Tax=Agrobacterium tumefaciens TaxID=358 RepID=UPI001F432809|nr:SDR family NAD(P)-dependent oxidoreductase [Agrobacterium tumefaciens]
MIENHPDLNVVFNNAGFMPFDDVSGTIDDAVAQDLITTNLLGPIRVTSALIEHLKTKPKATVLYTSSVLAYVSIAGNAISSATKAALHSFALSSSFQLRDTSVRVQEIAPPWVDTDLIYKSGDPRAMPLPDFIEQTLVALATYDPEVIIDAIRALRDNLGAKSTAFSKHSIEVSSITRFRSELETKIDVARPERHRPQSRNFGFTAGFVPGSFDLTTSPSRAAIVPRLRLPFHW